MGVGVSTSNLDFLLRLGRDATPLASAIQRLNVGLRVAMPGLIMAFDATKQSCTVRPMITENVYKLTDKKTLTRTVTQEQIPDLFDVPLLITSDQNFAITLPVIVGTECLVVFADMCFNSWWANGANQDSNGVTSGQSQERKRRHSLSDGFAILSPKSNPKAIANYSTDALEIRSLDGNAKFSIDTSDNILIKTKDGSLILEADNGDLEINGPTVGAATYNNISNSVPIKINGATYYIKLSTSP